MYSKSTAESAIKGVLKRGSSMIERSKLILIGICTVLFVSGCSHNQLSFSSPTMFPNNQSQVVTTALPTLEADKELYIEVSAQGKLDYFKNHKLGMNMAGVALGVMTEYVGPDNYDLAAMKAEFHIAIKRHPSGIVVVGFDSTLNELVNEAAQEKVPVVTVDSDLPGSERIAFVGTGNHQAGYEGALKLGELIGGVGKIVLMSRPGQPNLDERVQGYMDALRTYPKIELVKVINTKADPTVGAQELEQAIAEIPDLAGIGCVEASGGLGAIQAINETGKKSQLKVVAMDNDEEVVKGIESEIISATVVQQTALMSFYAVQILYNHKHGPLLSNMENTMQAKGTPMMIDTGVVIMDKSNYKEIQQNK
jgi:ribose transport system substrate-binding protein